MSGRPAAEWMDYAACRGRDFRLFFAPPGRDLAAATALCQGCEVRRDCLEYALATDVPDARYGIWGGFTGEQRQREAERRRKVRRSLGMVSR